MPIRGTASSAACLERLRCALAQRGFTPERIDDLLPLVEIVELPPSERLAELSPAVAAAGVDDLVHCAGCVDYFDKRRLELANVTLTSRLLETAQHWDIRRFCYISTAYCSGYQSGMIRESLHPDPSPENEPTEYTRTKRIAEWLVADNGIPFVIIRPSIVIGDSRTGTYTGKNYGLYQMWRAIEGLLCREYYPTWYTVAPPIAVDFVHQDAFQDAFIGIFYSDADNAVVHVVAEQARRPTMLDLCRLWANVYCPAEIHCYASVDDVPLSAIPLRQRRFLELAAKNLEIATHSWCFETRFMDGLRASGQTFANATLETITRCQHRYIEGSSRIREHMSRYGGEPRSHVRLLAMSA